MSLCSFLSTAINSSKILNKILDCVWNVMAHAQKPDFVFRLNGQVHLNRQGRQFSRLLAAKVCVSAVVMLDTASSEVVKGTGYLLPSPVFPSLPLPCFTMCHHISTGLYQFLLLVNKLLLYTSFCVSHYHHCQWLIHQAYSGLKLNHPLTLYRPCLPSCFWFARLGIWEFGIYDPQTAFLLISLFFCVFVCNSDIVSFIQNFIQNLNLENLGIDRKILVWILQKQDVSMWTGFIGLRIESVDNLLCTWCWTFKFHKSKELLE